MHIVAIDHVQLAMPPGGEPDARAFYAGVLGMKEAPKPEALAVRGGCWFEFGAAKIHLGIEEDFRPARKAHPALVADDLDGLAQALERAGHEIRFGEVVNGAKQVFVDDPFGNRIELIQQRAAK